MKSLMPKIDSNDGLFHNGNPATGEQGTRVTDTWLNDVQDRVRDVQAEAHYVLGKAGFKPVENKQTQLYEAIVKIIDDNRKSASTTQKGEVWLTSDTGLDSEELGLTAKAGKALAQGIAILRLALNNYIPNSKKSNAVDSNSADTVATSLAVKTAYDLANTKVSKSGDTMTDVLIFDTKNWAQTKYTTQGGIWRFEVAPAGDLASNTARFNYVFVDNTGAERSRIAFNQSTGTSIVAYQGWVGDNYLPLSGGSLRGELSLPTLKVTANNTGKGIE
ncbi:phage tail protein, partial [Pasteurella bettyae]|uniref:phage tail protein n=1 Tax=Pasteurella bettyae TaxID=752 RepID=UPI003D28ACD3